MYDLGSMFKLAYIYNGPLCVYFLAKVRFGKIYESLN